MIAGVLASALAKQAVNWQHDTSKTNFATFHGVFIPHVEPTPGKDIARFFAPFDLPWIPNKMGIKHLLETMRELTHDNIPFGVDLIEKDFKRYPYVCIGYNTDSETWTFVTRKPNRKRIVYAYVNTKDLKE